MATSQTEYEYIRSQGLHQPIAVVPNGIELPASTVACRTAPVDRAVRTALFLSRIHPVKGLVNLVRAWGDVRPEGWRLLVVGPDEDGHLVEVMRVVREEGVGECITFAGEVGAEDKAALFSEADLFILPTFSENFGVAVAEALSFGIPVITTQGAPWSDLETHGCGWWIPVGVEPLVRALRVATTMPHARLFAMGQRGRSYVQRYEWTAIASELASVYRWMFGAGDRPSTVHTG
jgi:glycosyltransferase involved in cell wall biosynthesis